MTVYKCYKCGLMAGDGAVGCVLPQCKCALLAAPQAAQEPGDERALDSAMTQVTRQDANNYCLILRALGMEEEGDPVEEVRRLVAQEPRADERAELDAEAERIAEAAYSSDYDAESAIKALVRKAIESGQKPPADDWQQQCLDKGFKYVRTPDDHYVICTKEQAVDLLRDVLGVDVHIEPQEPRRPMTDEERRGIVMAAYDVQDAIRMTERYYGITGEPTADPLQALTDASKELGLEP